MIAHFEGLVAVTADEGCEGFYFVGLLEVVEDAGLVAESVAFADADALVVYYGFCAVYTDLARQVG